MSVAIVYATVHGSTEKAAKLLHKQIENSEVFDINRDSFDLSKYDTVIIGSYVKMGMFDRNIRKFVLKYFNVLMKKNTGFFMCSMMPENAEKYWKNNFPPQILEKSPKAHFGSEFRKDEFRGFEKRIARMVSKENNRTGIYPEYRLDEKAIAEFGKEFK